MDLKTSLSSLSGIGPSYAKRLAYLGLHNIEELINHYPFRYDDFSQKTNISEVKLGDVATVLGEVWSIKNTYTKFKKVLTKALINDGTGSLEIVWFNQPYLTKSIKIGDSLQLAGKAQKYNYKVSLVAPDWEKINQTRKEGIHTGRLVPVYPETYGISSKWLRFKISQILPKFLPKIIDPLPKVAIGHLIPLEQALNQIHFPQDQQEIIQAKRRLSFDELFYIQLATLKKRADWQKKKLIKPWQIDEDKLSKFITNLPFELTNAQKRVLKEIITDLKKGQPMNRLLQGEVGSGKTVIAAATTYLAFLNGLKSVVMAPTEILAFQHFQTLSKLLGPYKIQVGIYTGSRKKVDLDHQIIVGTHALLSEKLELDQVGLVVIDEQQRFGVEQRSLLRNRSKSPHLLTMTATPIPRTVALTLYGDLDLSIIDELPVGRKVVRTYFVPATKRNGAYEFIGKQIAQGNQVYIITPLIEEPARNATHSVAGGSETQYSAKAAKVEFERLKREVFPQFKLGLLHGKLKSKEKEQVINDFKDHQIDILVSTSVVEVGVDIPNATVMVIEGAEKFGLAQLHQLRGRVGRGSVQSFAFLFTQSEEYQIVSRIKNLEKIHDGLQLAELDLKIRGSGEIFGTKQSGKWDLKIASLSNLKLIEQTREAALKILSSDPNLDKYPKLSAKLFSLAPEVMPD